MMAFSYRQWDLLWTGQRWRGTRAGAVVTAPTFCGLLIALSTTPLLVERYRRQRDIERGWALLQAYLDDEDAEEAAERPPVPPTPLRAEYLALLATLQAWHEALAAEDITTLEAWHATPEVTV